LAAAAAHREASPGVVAVETNDGDASASGVYIRRRPQGSANPALTIMARSARLAERLSSGAAA
jgi:hypothetical protein